MLLDNAVRLTISPSNASAIDSSSLNWTTIQPVLFDDADADVLILLDCCYAGSARFRAASTGRGTKEILAACSNRLPTTGVEYRSFTSVLIDELKGAAAENRLRGDSLSVVELHSYMHDNRKLQYQPIYAQVNRNRHHTISLIPFPLTTQGIARDLSCDSDTVSMVPHGRLRSSNSTRVLLAIHTSRSPTEDLIGFLKNECMLPLYVTGMKIEDVVSIEGIYESESTLAMLSVPMSVWALLPDHAACRYIGKIKSKNLCQLTSVQQLFTQSREPSLSPPKNADQDGNLSTQQNHSPKQDSDNSALYSGALSDSPNVEQMKVVTPAGGPEPEEALFIQLQAQWEEHIKDLSPKRQYSRVAVLLLYWIKAGASYLDTAQEVRIFLNLKCLLLI